MNNLIGKCLVGNKMANRLNSLKIVCQCVFCVYVEECLPHYQQSTINEIIIDWSLLGGNKGKSIKTCNHSMQLIFGNAIFFCMASFLYLFCMKLFILQVKLIKLFCYYKRFSN